MKRITNVISIKTDHKMYTSSKQALVMAGTSGHDSSLGMIRILPSCVRECSPVSN